MLRKAIAAIGLATLATIVSPAAAHIPDSQVQPDAVIQGECYEVFPVVDVPAEATRKLVPERFEVDGDKDGRAQLLIAIRKCDSLSVGNVTVEDAIDSYISIRIDSLDSKEEDAPPHTSFVQPVVEGDVGEVPALPQEVYIIQWITNKKVHAAWLKDYTGLGNKVRVVSDLVFNYNPEPDFVAGAIDPVFEFDAPAPAPSPFRVDAKVIEPSGIYDVRINLWAKSEEGTVIILGEHHMGPDQRFGPAEGMVTSKDQDSPLSSLLEGQSTRSFGGLSGFFSNGQWTKCVRNSSNPCTSNNH